MSRSDHIIPLYDESGTLYAVMLSAELWQRGAKRLGPALEQALEIVEPKAPSPEPMEEWETFKDYWDFQYPVNASVRCEHCGASTEDWEHDETKLFRLRSAQLGGLIVFTCLQCQSTVRKKHFKDHICFECTPGGGCEYSAK